jgi:hypothetical protein
MNLRNTREIKDFASRRLEASASQKQIVLIYIALALGLTALVTVLNHVLDLQIENFGGLSNLGKKTMLSSVQSMLPMAQSRLVIYAEVPGWLATENDASWRIELTCGARALRLMQGIFEQNRQVSQLFSAKIMETGTAAAKINQQLSSEKLRANQLQTTLLRHTAKGYEMAGNVVHFEENLDGAQLRELTDAIAKVCGGRAAVLSGTGESWNICMLHPGGDLSGVITGLKAAFPVRGGGKPGSFQGTVTASRQQLEAFFAAL